MDDDETEKAICQSQVLIPFLLENQTFAFLGMYPHTNYHQDVESFFPRNSSSPLLVFNSQVNPRFLESIGNAFKSMFGNFNPSKSTTKKPALNVLYLEWLDRVVKYKYAS